MSVARQPMLHVEPGVAVDDRLGDALQQAHQQLVAQCGDAQDFRQLRVAGATCGRCRDSRYRWAYPTCPNERLAPDPHRESAAPASMSVTAAAHRLPAAPELVAGKAQRVGTHFVEVDVDVTGRLHRVGVDRYLKLVGNLDQAVNGLDSADLVVGPHDAD